MSRRARAAAIAAVLAACGGGRKQPPAAAPPPDATVAPPPPGAAWRHAPAPPPDRLRALIASPSLRCLLDRRGGSDELTVDAGPAQIAIVTAAMVERARRDGDSPTAAALLAAISLQVAVDDRAALLASLAEVERLGHGHQVPDDVLARAGRAVDASDYPDLPLVVALALGGDRAAAAARYARPAYAAKPDEDVFTRSRRVAALVAIGRDDDARALVAAATPAARLELLGAWVDVALAQGGDATPAIAALVEALAAAAPASGAHWNPRQTLARARRTGRSDELRALRAALARVVSADEQGLVQFLYEDALAIGDDAVVAALGSRVEAAARASLERLYRAPLADAIAAIPVTARPESWKLARLWMRHAFEGGDPAIERALAERTCGGAVPVPLPPGPPAPALDGARLVVVDRRPRKLAPCDGVEAEVRLERAGRAIARERLGGECSGACDEAAQRAGQDELDELQAQVDRGEVSQSVTDYNFTSCLWSGTRAGTLAHPADRDVAILVEGYLGPHDLDQVRYVLATEVCGALYLSPSFAATYSRDFPLDSLTLAASPDGRELIVSGAIDVWRGVLLRVTLPVTCPGEAVAETVDPEL